MKNIFLKLTLIFSFLFVSFFTSFVNAWTVNIPSDSTKTIKEISISSTSTWDLVTDVNNFWLSILKTLKTVLFWVIILFLVYAWIQMIMSMWSDDEKLSKAKRQVYYSVIWLAFINIPWFIISAFIRDSNSLVWWYIPYASWVDSSSTNLFINSYVFWETLNEKIIWFIEVALVWIAVFMIIFSWIKILTSRGRDERIKEWKNKIVWSIIWLLFVSFIEVFKKFVFDWKISDGLNIFQSVLSIALFLAWPIAILFLTIAWYYYITSNWDEEKIKKAKNIIINTILATIILLASYSFLLDLINL